MNTGGFSIIDYIILGGYILGVTFLGSLFYKGQKTSEDFFLAGRSMPWFPVAISIYATMFSAISYMGMPAWTFKYDLKYSLTTLSLPIAVPFVIILFIRFYYKLKIFTAYEYLEKRFDVRVRSIASFLFIFLRIGWMATMLYASALALSEASGAPLIWTILVAGILVTFYTVMGGMKAVIWTDVAQAVVLFGGVLFLWVVAVRGIDGGLGEILSVARASGKLKTFDFSLDPTVRVTIWASLIGGLFINLSSYGADQTVIQRYLTTRSVQDTKKALKFSAFYAIPNAILFYGVGIVLFVFYQQHPDLLASLSRSDCVVPHFIVHQLPPGVSGLLIAAIFAATMSSIDSGLNSISTATVVDFYRRLIARTRFEHHYLKAGRICTVFWGLVVTLAAIFVKRLGTIVEISVKINGFFGGVLLGIFLLGLLTKRANTFGVILGAAIGMTVVSLIGLKTGTSFLWYSAIGCITTFMFGYALSFCFVKPKAEKINGLVWSK